MEIFKNTAVILGCITSTITIVVAIVPRFRRRVALWVRGKSGASYLENEIRQMKDMLEKHVSDDTMKREDIALQKEAMKCMLRDSITHIYYKRSTECEIPIYELEDLVHLYESYTSLGGNSYVQKLYQQMTEEWTIKR